MANLHCFHTRPHATKWCWGEGGVSCCCLFGAVFWLAQAWPGGNRKTEGQCLHISGSTVSACMNLLKVRLDQPEAACSQEDSLRREALQAALFPTSTFWWVFGRGSLGQRQQIYASRFSMRSGCASDEEDAVSISLAHFTRGVTITGSRLKKMNMGTRHFVFPRQGWHRYALLDPARYQSLGSIWLA